MNLAMATTHNPTPIVQPLPDDEICSLCRTSVRRGHLGSHQKSGKCKALQESHALEKAGWVPCDHHSRIFKALGIEVRYVKLQVYSGALQATPFAPGWAVAVANVKYPTKRWKRRALTQAIADPEWARGILGAQMLGTKPETVGEVVVQALKAMLPRKRS